MRWKLIFPASVLVPLATAATLAGILLISALALVTRPAVASEEMAAPTPTPGVSVLTFHNDNLRSGHNPNETILKPLNVTPATFGKLFSFPVDGYLYAAPLYVPQLAITGKGTYNVVFVASEHDSVYAFDADGAVATPLWQTSFINPGAGITTVSSLTDIGCDNLVPEIGITGTPVISMENQALYVVSEVKNQNNDTYLMQIHALDLATGAEKFGGPVAISASVKGTGAGSDGTGHVTFDAKLANQRPALLLANGMIYVAFASNCDIGSYHGWVLAYDALTLAQKAVFNATPNGRQGGIWQSGNGPSASIFGRIFIGIGNGTFDGISNYGDSFLKLGPMLHVLDYFTPSDESSLDVLDLDAGITGAVLLPAPTYQVMGGVKNGRFYLLRSGSMGKFCATCDDSQAAGILDLGHSLFDVPAYASGRVYIGADGARLKSWSVVGGALSPIAIARTAHAFGYPGTSPAISSDSGLHTIIWALDVSGYNSSDPAVLYAYQTDLTKTYDSTQAGSRDTAGPAVKFTVPTVANGKVYVGTQTELDVYGLLP